MAGSDGDTNTGSVNSRTADGMGITIEISFQYRIEKENVIKLFNLFSTDYEYKIYNFARDKVRDVISMYNAEGFFTNRTSIATHMGQQVKENLANISVTLEYFQLSKVILPPRYDKAIEEKEITVQLETQAEFEQKVKLTSADTKIATARELYQKTIAIANANKNLNYYTAYKEGEKLKISISADAKAYDALQTQIVVNRHMLLNLMWHHTLMEKNGSHLVIGFDKTHILKLPRL